MKPYLFFIPLLFICNSIVAQNGKNDTVILEEVTIKSLKLNHSSKFSENIEADSILKNDFIAYSISDLINVFGNANIKSYGGGMLSTVSLRGASSSQTLINWNGININNSMSGQTDLSIIPVFFADEISIQSGGTSAVWGSGSIGGTININNVIPSDTGISLIYEKTYGSFGLSKNDIKTSAGWRKGAVSIRAFDYNSDNDFTYKNISKQNFPEEKLINAKCLRAGVLPELFLKIKKNQTLNIKSWIQTNKQQIPPAMIYDNYHEWQSEDFVRTIAEWEMINNNKYLILRAAYFNNTFKYSSDFQPYTSVHKSNKSLIEINSGFNVFKNLSINGLINYTYEDIKSTDYINPKDRNSTSISVNGEWEPIKSLVLSASVREEYYNSVFSPFLFSAGVNKSISNKLMIKASASRNFCYPSFNDLYWQPGGNPNLNPENGYSEEIGIKWKSLSPSSNTEILISAFNSNINNRIMWLPDSNNFLWTASNWSKAWSRGVDINFLSSLKLSKSITLQLRISGIYNKATGDNLNDDSNKKQLIYVPLINANSSASIVIKKLSFSWYFHYSDKRFTTSDNTTYLYPYSVSSLSINKLFSLKKIQLNCFVHIDNVFNNQYQIIEWRPAPKRNYQAGMRISI